MAQRLGAQTGQQIVCGDLGHAVAAGDRRTANVRDDHAVGQSQQRIIRVDGFRISHIQASGEDLIVTQCLIQVALVVNWTPSTVNEYGGLLHSGKRCRIKHAVRLFVEVRVNRDEIGFGQQSIEIYVLGVERLFGLFISLRIVIENSHVPAAATSLGHGEPDASHADDAEGAETTSVWTR